mgnify:CR=1 FL=1
MLYLVQGTQWTLGSAIYVGWISAAGFLVVSVILMIGCFRDDGDDDDEHYPHPDGKYFDRKNRKIKCF